MNSWPRRVWIIASVFGMSICVQAQQPTLIRNTFGEAGFPAPGQFVFLKNENGAEVFASASTH